MVSQLKKSFEGHRDKCLSACEEYWANPEPMAGMLKYQITDPAKGWERHQQRLSDFERWEQIKTNLYTVYGADLFSGEDGWYPWVGEMAWPWIEDQKTYCSLSPKCLEEIGMQGGDELWYWRTNEHSWEHMFGRAGYLLLRNNEVIWSMITEEN